MINKLVAGLFMIVLLFGFGAPSIQVARHGPNPAEMRLHVVRHPGVSGLPPLDIVVQNPYVPELLAMLKALPPEPVRTGNIECGLDQGLSYELTFISSTNMVFHATILSCGSLGIIADDHIAHAPDKQFFQFFQATMGHPVFLAWINLYSTP